MSFAELQCAGFWLDWLFLRLSLCFGLLLLSCFDLHCGCVREYACLNDVLARADGYGHCLAGQAPKEYQIVVTLVARVMQVERRVRDFWVSLDVWEAQSHLL